MGEMVECPSCGGEKEVFAHVNTTDPKTHGFQYITCFRCKGEGVVPAEMYEWIREGKKMREDRKVRRETLRQAANRLGVTVAQYSMMEMGMMEMGRIKPNANPTS